MGSLLISFLTGPFLFIVVVVSVPDGFFITGGELGQDGVKFKVEQFHFHWGADDRTGSEHVIDYQQFPLEVTTFNTH